MQTSKGVCIFFTIKKTATAVSFILYFYISISSNKTIASTAKHLPSPIGPIYSIDFALIETEIKGKKIKSKYTLCETGVEIKAETEGEFAFLLPALHFDGKDYSEVTLENNILKINYQGNNCVYKANANIKESGKLSANRNGIYKSYIIDAENSLNITIEIN